MKRKTDGFVPRWKFDPQPDITAYELARLFKEIFTQTSRRGTQGTIDMIHSMGLERHFILRDVEVEKQSEI